MARKKNYTSDQLKYYVDAYFRQKNDYSAVTASAVAEYCNETLHLLPTVTYQNFTRDKEVMRYIEHINAELHDRMLVPEDQGAASHIDSFYIDDSADAEETRAKAYEELEKREDLIRALQSEYKKCSTELASALKERDALLDINKGLRDTVTDQKKEIASQNKQLREAKSLLARFRKYFKEYLYDPIVLRRVAELGWVSDKRDAVRRCSVTADLIAELEGIHKKSEVYLYGQGPSDTDSEDVQPLPPAGEHEHIEADVVNSKSADFLSRLRSL